MTGYVYLIEEVPHEMETTGAWTKIGTSCRDPRWRRDANLKRGNSRKLRIRYAFEFKTAADARREERSAHQEFIQFNHNGEWFSVRSDVVADWLAANGEGVIRPDLAD